MRGRRSSNSAAVLLAVALVWVGVSRADDAVPAGPGAARARAEIAVVQDGRPVLPSGGVYRLRRSPFTVQVAPGAGRLSVFATTAADAAAGARALWSAPLVAPLGNAAAASPLSLHVSEEPPEFHGGLTPGFLQRWGSDLGAAHLTEYGAMRGRLSLEPNILASPRQYANVLRSHDGTQHLMVFRVGDVPVGEWPGDALSLFVFADRETPVGARALWTMIDDLEVLQIRFVNGDSAPAREAGAARFESDTVRSTLDCGDGAAVKAVRDGDWRRVERLLGQGLDPNLRVGPERASLLMCAVAARRVHATTVWALLEGGAEVDARTPRDETALLLAIRSGERGQHSSDRLGAVGQLLGRGADPDAADVNGETPLLAAVAMGYAEVSATLLAAGADPRRGNLAGETPLARAVRLGQRDLAALIRLYAGDDEPASAHAGLGGLAAPRER